MKTISKFLVFAFSALLLTSCVDELNTAPEGSTKTAAQKEAAIAANPDLLAADLAAIYAQMIDLYAGLGSGNGWHSDFGYSAMCMIYDQNGQDMVSANIGYNWFSSACDFSDRVYTSGFTLMQWRVYYKIIYAANSVLEMAPADSDNETLLAYRGEALAARAFCYLNMAQMYQFNYNAVDGTNALKPCVPIVTDNLPAEKQSANPRATVKEVYDMIFADLNEAVTLLDGAARVDKGHIDQSVALGLRARAELVTHQWAAAAADAAKALEVGGATPYTIDEVSKPGFWNAEDHSVMWANIITENNDIVLTGIINYPSHLSSLFTDGYTGVGAYRSISQLLYDQILPTDVRKGWWLDESSSSPLLEGNNYSAWEDAATAGPYANVKFGVDGDDMNNLSAASDWFLMRAEEMILIQAEGLVMSGKTAEGKKLLENFVKTYRDPSYVSTAADALGLQDEIWLQRRIELWGEGFSYFDIMRLEKPIIRKDNGVSNFPAAWQFNIPAKSQILLWLIPSSEIEANKGISESDNNPAVNPPTA